MKKVLSVILIIFGIFAVILLIDTLQAKSLNNRPFIKVTENYDAGNLYQKDRGILVDTYIYTNGKEETVFKWEKYTYSIDNDEDNNKDSKQDKFGKHKAVARTKRVGGLIAYNIKSDLINEIPEEYFLNLDKDITYEELVSEIGEPSGTIGSGMVRYYWRIGENKYAVWEMSGYFEIWEGND